MAHLEFVFPSTDQNQKDFWVALLNEEGFTGFEDSPDALKAYINEVDFNSNSFDILVNKNNITYNKSIVLDRNWNEEWESGFDPVTIFNTETNKPFVHIHASFHKPIPDARWNVQITPKMSFGTGHHATTYLMVEAMQGLDFTNQSILDFGTGTGVLAILAEKLGAVTIYALDNDSWSIENAAENIKANACSKIQLMHQDKPIIAENVSILLANINLNVILDTISNLFNCCKAGADCLFSGILIDDQELIVQALRNNQFVIKSVNTRNNWIIIHAKKSSI